MPGLFRTNNFANDLFFPRALRGLPAINKSVNNNLIFNFIIVGHVGHSGSTINTLILNQLSNFILVHPKVINNNLIFNQSISYQIVSSISSGAWFFNHIVKIK